MQRSPVIECYAGTLHHHPSQKYLTTHTDFPVIPIQLFLWFYSVDIYDCLLRIPTGSQHLWCVIANMTTDAPTLLCYYGPSRANLFKICQEWQYPLGCIS
jgi:hypothetical protein